MKRITRIVTFTLSLAAVAAAAQASSLLGALTTLTDAPADPAPAAATAPGLGDAPPMVIATASARVQLRDGTYAGQPYDAYYGMVQVQATVQNGQIAAVNTLQSPDRRSTSRAINRKALPMLESEVVQAQTVRVNMISGATLTSRAYLRSLNSALKQAVQ